MAFSIVVLLLGLSTHAACAQKAGPEDLSKQIQQLTDAMARTQSQLEESQRQLDAMRAQIDELKRELAESASGKAPANDASADNQDKPAPKRRQPRFRKSASARRCRRPRSRSMTRPKWRANPGIR